MISTIWSPSNKITGTAPILMDSCCADLVKVEVVKKYPCSYWPWIAPRNSRTSFGPTEFCQRLHWNAALITACLLYTSPDTNGSQFFITELPTPHLNGSYTIFGQCDDATVTLVKEIARMATDPMNNRPFRPVKITHITITHASAAAAKPATTVKKAAPAPAKPSPTPN